jgi:glycerophosphoryl diester phosphodiesterase
VKALLRRVRTGFIYSRELDDPLSVAVSSGADALLPRKDRLTSSLVEQAHRHGLIVVPWVLNAEDEVMVAQDAGADGIVSDDPCGMSICLRDREKTRR